MDRRVIIATCSGLLFGFICVGLSALSPAAEALAWPIAVQLVLSRTLIGFAIGISRLTLGHWARHGLFMGLCFSLPLAFSGLMAPENLDYSKAGMFAATCILGMVYGLLTEVITTAVFKAGPPLRRAGADSGQ